MANKKENALIPPRLNDLLAQDRFCLGRGGLAGRGQSAWPRTRLLLPSVKLAGMWQLCCPERLLGECCRGAHFG